MAGRDPKAVLSLPYPCWSSAISNTRKSENLSCRNPASVVLELQAIPLTQLLLQINASERQHRSEEPTGEVRKSDFVSGFNLPPLWVGTLAFLPPKHGLRPSATLRVPVILSKATMCHSV